MAITETRREVMTNAWARFRHERAMRRPITFSTAMRDAWAWVKGATARAEAAAAWAAAPNKRVMHFGSASFSPIARVNAGRSFGNRATFKAAYTTAMVGCEPYPISNSARLSASTREPMERENDDSYPK